METIKKVKKSKSRISVVGLLVIISLIVTLYYVNSKRIKLDGIKGEVLSWFIASETLYAKGYSHEKFLEIKIGMTETEVQSILGPPLYTWKPFGQNTPLKKDYVGYVYSHNPNGSYRVRQVNLLNGKVMEIVSYFYID